LLAGWLELELKRADVSARGMPRVIGKKLDAVADAADQIIGLER
jgi:hypothetical protein